MRDARERRQNEQDEREQITCELEHRGVPRGVSRAMANRLIGSVAKLDPASYAAALDGAAASRSGQCADPRAVERSEKDLEHIEYLMQGFAAELRKLEESLRVISAYVTRMHDTAKPPPAKTSH